MWVASYAMFIRIKWPFFHGTYLWFPRKKYGQRVSLLPWMTAFTDTEVYLWIFLKLNPESSLFLVHLGESKYLVLVDLDEMIVPRRSKNYSQLLEDLHTLSNKKKIGAYSFQNGFFYLQWPDDLQNYNLTHYPLAETVSHQLLMLRKTRRRSRLHPHKQRWVDLKVLMKCKVKIIIVPLPYLHISF